MGFEKIKRPLLAPGANFSGSGASTSPGSVTGDLVLSDTVRAVGMTLSGAMRLPTESITLSTVAQTISRDGVSFLTYASSGKPNDAILQAPSAVGQVKYIFLINNTTSVEANINTAATAQTFWGTTYNTATVSAASTGSPGGTPAGSAMLGLIAHSTTQWALFPGSSYNWDLSGTTGSTATA